MKFKMIYLSFALMVLFLTNFSSAVTESVGGRTGAPGESNCNSCHGNSVYGTSVSIKLLNLQTGAEETTYTPNQKYKVRLTIATTSLPSGYGFQMVSLINAGNIDVNGWSNPSANARIQQLNGGSGRTYIEHTSTSSSNIAQSDWTAPAKGSGTVTFYASGNSVNNNGNSDNGDDAKTGRLAVAENVNTATKDFAVLATQITTFPNPTTEKIVLRWNSPTSDIYTVSISDSKGSVLQTTRWDVVIGNNEQAINVQNLPKGNYIITLLGKNAKASKQFVKI